MRRFFTVLFMLSPIASAAAFYWRTCLPEGNASIATERSLRAPSAGSSEESGALSVREASRAPFGRQDLAVTISIMASNISAVAALAQTWLTARAYRR